MAQRRSPTTKATRQPVSPPFGVSSPPTMPLIPAMRPFSSSMSVTASPIKSPPANPLTGVKSSTSASVLVRGLPDCKRIARLFRYGLQVGLDEPLDDYDVAPDPVEPGVFLVDSHLAEAKGEE